MSDPKQSYRVGDIDIRAAHLVNYNGSYVDLRPSLLEFNIFHDLLSPGIRAELLIYDANGLIENAPIVGDERIVISFKTPREPKYLDYTFRVYRITDRTKTEPRAETYTLHCASREMIANERVRISAAYQDLEPSEVVTQMFRSYLSATDGSEKRVIVEKTSNKINAIFNNDKAFTGISFLAQESRSANTNHVGSTYILYERSDSWRFETLESIYAREVTDHFYMTLANVEQENRFDTEQAVHEYQKIGKLSQKSQLDTLQRLDRGLYANEVRTLDILTKQFRTDRFDYSKDHEELAHVEAPLKKSSANRLLTANTDLISSTPAISYLPGEIGTDYSNLPYLRRAKASDAFVRTPRTLPQTLKYDVAQRAAASSIVFDVSIPGNSTIDVGDVVALHIPQSTGVEENRRRENILFGERFVVAAVRHTYNVEAGQYFTVLQCIKDSYARIPSEAR